MFNFSSNIFLCLIQLPLGIPIGEVMLTFSLMVLQEIFVVLIRHSGLLHIKYECMALNLSKWPYRLEMPIIH